MRPRGREREGKRRLHVNNAACPDPIVLFIVAFAGRDPAVDAGEGDKKVAPLLRALDDENMAERCLNK